MSYKLFIDDERYPVTDDWIIVRSSSEALDYVVRNGMPEEIAFDHDLGKNDTSIHFINVLMDWLLCGNFVLPPNFKYSVHSQNPVGAQNIKHKMDAIIYFCRGQYE